MSQVINDSLTSLITSMGDPNRDKLAAVQYSGQVLSDQQIQNAYRTGWMAKRLVNTPAKDALRNWRIWQGTAEQTQTLEKTEMRLGLQGKLLKCLILARVLGGAALFIGTGDKDLSKPLDPNRIDKDGIKYLTVLPKTALAAADLDSDVLGDNYGKPLYYELITNNNLVKIHPSRLVILKGEVHIDEWTVMDSSRGWGDSIIQASYAALKNSNATDDNVASLIFEANINVVAIPDLMSKLGDPRSEQQLLKRLSLAAAQKGIHGDLLIDSEESFTRNSASFANLDNIMERFAILVGATQGIPASKFLGQLPRGLNSSVSGELDNYYDDIKTMQTLEIQPALQILDECLIRSALGARPDDISYLWTPLAQASSKEIAETGEKLANTIRTLVDSGLYEAGELREAATNQLVNMDVLPNLGDAVMCSNNELDDDFNLDNEGDITPDVV